MTIVADVYNFLVGAVAPTPRCCIWIGNTTYGRVLDSVEDTRWG